VPETRLAFPFNLRPLLALWNGLFLEPGIAAPVAARSAQWNRGAYLVDGIGHCGGCHTARNALGAERGGSAYLGGARVDGWEAQPLTALSMAPLPWSADELFRYLRHGDTLQHGGAAGPMAMVVRNLGALPDADVRAMAHYLASFNPALPPAEAEARAARRIEQSAARAREPALVNAAARLFTGACGACHHDGDGPATQGRNLPLALNSNLHAASPDNLLRVVLEGIREPAFPELGHMPAFRDSLDDAQIAELAAWMRQRFAPDQPAWPDLAARVAAMRAIISAE